MCGLFSSNKTSIEIYKELLANPIFKDEYPSLDFSEIEVPRVKMAIIANYISVEPSTYKMAKGINNRVGMCLLESDADYLNKTFDKFSFSINELLEILRSDKLKPVHSMAISKIAVDDISSEDLAKSVLEWLCEGENHTSVEQFDKAIGFISDAVLLKLYLTVAIKKGLIASQDVFIEKYMNRLGKEYKKLGEYRKDFNVSKTDIDQKLVYALKDYLHLLRKVEVLENVIKCSTRYFK